MKKLYVMSLMTLLFGLRSFGAIVLIEVEDTEFTPSVFSINIGDTIIWMWDEGTHTTTSLSIPPGALSWNEAMDQNNIIFIYVPQIEGTYNYQCNFHYTMGMVGSFTVLTTNGVNDIVDESVRLKTNLVTSILTLERLPAAVAITPVIRDLTGKIVKRFDLLHSSKEIEFFVGDLNPGIYIFQLSEGDRKNNIRFIKN